MKLFNRMLVSLLLLFSCHQNSSEILNTANDTLTATSKTEKPVIDLYAVNPAYYPFLPDSSLIFNNIIDLRNYYLPKFRDFLSFCDSLVGRITIKNKDSVLIANRSAWRLFSDISESMYYKYAKDHPDGKASMGALGFFSPYSNIVTIGQRRRVFQSFPLSIRNSDVGKKVWAKFEEYTFEKNIGFNVSSFDEISVKDSTGNIFSIGNLFNKRHRYNVLVIGASWCSPCRIEEMQLKYWVPLIDTSVVRIIGLSVDSSPQKWIKALMQDDLPWKNYLLENGMRNPMIKKLDFDGIPMNILLDRKKTIVAQNTDIRKILKQIPIIDTK